MKHTQGEWEIRGNVIFIKNTYKSIATVSVHKNYEDVTFKPIQDVEMESNAKLIAASPELLEALKEIINDVDVWNNLIESHRERIINAINKATL